MLSSAETVEVIAEALVTHGVSRVVLDPVYTPFLFLLFIFLILLSSKVMVSTSGSQLLPRDAVRGVRTKLLPLTTVLTPNIPEARLLLEDAGISYQDPQSVDDMIQLAKQIRELGPKNVLLKGGHLPLTKERKAAKSHEEASIVIDVLYDGENAILFETDFLTSKNTHGTGCSLASAIAANLASGKDMVRSVRSAVRFVEAGIKTSVDIGKGNGPINHFHSVYSLPFAPYAFQVSLLYMPVRNTLLVVPLLTKIQRSILGIYPRPSGRQTSMEGFHGARICRRFGQRYAPS